MKQTHLVRLKKLIRVKGYSKDHIEVGAAHIVKFVDTLNKPLKYITLADVNEYIKSASCQASFWIQLFYTDFLSELKTPVEKLIKIELQLMAVYNDRNKVKEMMVYIRRLSKYTGKPLYQISQDDVTEFLQVNNIHGEELSKARDVFKIFNYIDNSQPHTILIITKNKDFVKGSSIINEPKVQDLIQKANERGMHYCIKCNFLVKICRMSSCTFVNYTCPAKTPIVSDAQVPIPVTTSTSISA